MEQETPAETPAQRQARIRREKRERKVLEGASSRLDKITSLSGRPAEQAPPPLESGSSSGLASPETAPTSTSGARPSAPAPEWTDQAPAVDQQELEASMRRLLRGAEPGPGPAASGDGVPPGSSDERPGEDPMLRLMQQLMGMSPPTEASGDANPVAGGLPPNLASMLGGGDALGGARGGQPPPTKAYLWKILHAFFAFCLGAYIVMSYAFTGSIASRIRLDSSTLPSEGIVFWIFVTTELGLQTTKYLLEGGGEGGGITGTLAGFLPSPWKQRLLLAGRYSGIWTTLVEDAMVVIWMLGAVAWWRGELL